MSFSLTFGNGPSLSVDSLADLKAAAQSVLELDPKLTDYLAGPLSAVPAVLSSTAVQWGSGNQSWTPGAAATGAGGATPITFTLSGGVAWSISILTSGDLFSYTDGFPVTVTVEGGAGGGSAAANANSTTQISVADGAAYVCVSLGFQLSGGIAGSYSTGVYGVNTSDSAAGRITVAFYKRCAPSMKLQDALTAAFAGFVLPLHAETLTRLAGGDYLLYDFNANLQLGLGASVGFDKVLYAGQFAGQIPKTAGAVTINAAASPEVQAGAKLAFAYDYTGTFEMLLWKDAAGMAHVHLYRAKIQDTTVGLNAGLGLSAAASASVGVTPSQLQTAIENRIPSFAQGVFESKVWTPALGEVNKYVAEANAKVAGWLARVNQQKASLSVAIEQVNDRFLLTDYTIDLTKVYQPAWADMVAGKFLDAFALGDSGVSLDAGSGLEQVFSSATTVKLNLFGALAAVWTDTTISQSSLVYAGNGVFHLIAQEGKAQTAAVNQSRSEIDIYFAAEVDLTSATVGLKPGIDLHAVLTANHNAKFGALMAKIVGLLTPGADGAALASQVNALAAKSGTTETLHLVISASAYRALQASTKGNAATLALDEPNYDTFAWACAQLFGSTSPANFTCAGQAMSYSVWEQANMAATGSDTPDRTSSGNPAAAQGGYLSQQFNGQPVVLVWAALDAARMFMNLCADLSTLASTTANVTLQTWTDLTTTLGKIVKNDVSTLYMAPVALGIAKICGAAPKTVVGPVASLPPGSSVEVTMNY